MIIDPGTPAPERRRQRRRRIALPGRLVTVNHGRVTVSLRLPGIAGVSAVREPSGALKPAARFEPWLPLCASIALAALRALGVHHVSHFGGGIPLVVALAPLWGASLLAFMLGTAALWLARQYPGGGGKGR